MSVCGISSVALVPVSAAGKLGALTHHEEASHRPTHIPFLCCQTLLFSKIQKKTLEFCSVGENPEAAGLAGGQGLV